ncbi:MAG: Bax inhibitor-1 family protein [Kofleriaceae bacterium]|nr:Bax inhibitor-1 family protein [Kofleriaceae bacterium]MCL4225469.1 Bax inhibitor-1 family protein [Myxococcales bacterium]
MGSPAAAHGHRPIAGADATVGVSSRVRFIRLTYLHLLGAIVAFAGIEWLLFTNETLVTKVSAPLVNFAHGGRANWAVVLAVFMGVSIGTHWLAGMTRSRPLHYVGLAIYVIAEALIFVPLLAIVQWKSAVIVAKGGGDPNIIRDAAIITLAVFGALTASVLVTRKDFSFLRSALAMGGAAALGLIVLSLVFGFNLGIVFAVAMVLLAAGQILYETSQIMAHDDPESYVGAALSLFASIALMFWYVIRIVMRLRE